jgi:glycine cleavage system H lipoate-binding protein
MERRSEDDGTYRVIPEHDEACVWMVGGLLTYRLCDRDFDCDHCPLDAALRGTQLAPRLPALEVPATSPGSPATEIRDDLRYHPIYGWVAAAADGRLRWGIDGVTARILDRITSFVLPAVGTDLVQGQTACWAMDDGELVPLRSPVSGSVARTNPAVQRDPALATRSPYDTGWLVEVDAPEGLEAQGGLCGAAERREEAARQLGRVHRAVMSHLHMSQGVGPLAQDGGERLSDLRQVLGRGRYHRLVRSVLR